MRPLALQWSLFLISAYVPLCLHAIVCHRLLQFATFYVRVVIPRCERARGEIGQPPTRLCFFLDSFVPQANDHDCLTTSQKKREGAYLYLQLVYFTELDVSLERNSRFDSPFSNSYDRMLHNRMLGALYLPRVDLTEEGLFCHCFRCFASLLFFYLHRYLYQKVDY